MLPSIEPLEESGSEYDLNVALRYPRHVHCIRRLCFQRYFTQLKQYSLYRRHISGQIHLRHPSLKAAYVDQCLEDGLCRPDVFFYLIHFPKM